jgi:hypothetical protein
MPILPCCLHFVYVLDLVNHPPHLPAVSMSTYTVLFISPALGY